MAAVTWSGDAELCQLQRNIEQLYCLCLMSALLNRLMLIRKQMATQSFIQNERIYANYGYGPALSWKYIKFTEMGYAYAPLFTVLIKFLLTRLYKEIVHIAYCPCTSTRSTSEQQTSKTAYNLFVSTNRLLCPITKPCYYKLWCYIHRKYTHKLT